MTGQDRTWVVKTDQDRPDQIKAGQGSLEHVKNPQNIWNKTSFWNFVRLCFNLFVFISIFLLCSTYAAMHKFCACLATFYNCKKVRTCWAPSDWTIVTLVFDNYNQVSTHKSIALSLENGWKMRTNVFCMIHTKQKHEHMLGVCYWKLWI